LVVSIPHPRGDGERSTEHGTAPGVVLLLRHGSSASPTTYLLAEWTDETKVVLNYALSGPARLWALARLIDELLDEAEWDNP